MSERYVGVRAEPQFQTMTDEHPYGTFKPFLKPGDIVRFLLTLEQKTVDCVALNLYGTPVVRFTDGSVSSLQYFGVTAEVVDHEYMASACGRWVHHLDSLVEGVRKMKTRDEMATFAALLTPKPEGRLTTMDKYVVNMVLGVFESWAENCSQVASLFGVEVASEVTKVIEFCKVTREQLK